MRNTHPYLEVADRMNTIATLVGKRTEGVVSLPEGRLIVDPGLGLESHAFELNDSADNLQQGTTRIAAVGGVSAGKTTFLCAITGLELPMGVDAKTGVITEIVHGGDPNTVTVFYTNGDEKTMSMEEFKTFSALPAGSIKSGVPFPLPPHLMNVRSARVQSPSNFSKGGIILIDTLGFGAGTLAADVTRDKLRAADMAILVLGTRPPFSDNDVNFILEQIAEAQINDSKLRNIFWVFNDFSLRADEKQEVWNSARVKLEGLLDEEDFETNVYMIDAFKALKARQNGATSEVLEKTGLPALERAVEETLIGRKQRERVIESVVSRRVVPVIRVARTQIQQQAAAVDIDAEPLEKAVAEGQKALEAIRERAKKLLSQLNHARDEFIDAVISDYRRYFAGLSNKDWEQAWAEIAPKISMFEFTISVFSKRRRERLEDRLRAPLEMLIGGKLEEWGAQLPAAVSPTAFQEFEDIAVDFSEFLVAADENLVKGLGLNIDTEDLDVTRKNANAQRVLQMILGVLLLDPSQVVGTLYAPDWRSFFRRLIIEIISVVAAVVFFGPFGLIAVICVVIGEFLINILMDQGSRKDRLGARVALKIREQFAAESNSRRITDQIRSNLNERFKESHKSLDALMSKEISERQQRLDDLLSSKHLESSAADAERKRLHEINAAITHEWHAISKLVYGEVIDIDETEMRGNTEDEDGVLGLHRD